jgi:hypothetical protein
VSDIQDPQYKTSDGCALRIWRDTAKNNFLSERAGRPVFDEVILCEVIAPGSRDSTPVFELVRKYAEEMGISEPAYGLKYDDYKQYVEHFTNEEKIDASLSGTPLKEWAEIPRTLAATLRVANIYTVDALAALPDTKLSVVGPDGRTWRAKAQAYIDAAKDAGFATKLAADNEVLRTDNEALKAQVAELAAQVAALQKGDTAPAPVEKPAKGGAKLPDGIV